MDSLSQVIPLHFIAGSSSKYAYFMAETLLERGSDPNARNIDGLTPVHIAASWGNYETLKLLLLNGGDPWLMDDDGKTPLDLAIISKNEDCIRLLTWWNENIQFDSKPSTPTSANRSASKFAFLSDKPSPANIGYPSPRAQVYTPKYFSSPIREISTTSCSPSTGSNCNMSASVRGVSSKLTPCKSRRALNYEDQHCSSNMAVVKCESPLEGHLLDNLVLPTNLDEKPGVISKEKETTARGSSKDESLTLVTIMDSISKDLNGITSKTAVLSPKSNANLKKDVKEIPLNLEPDSDYYLSFSCDDLNETIDQLNKALKLDSSDVKRALSAIETTIQEQNRDIDPKQLSACKKLTDSELRRQAINQGMDVGPITPGTRFLYVRQLACLLSNQRSGKQKKYLPELQSAIDGNINKAKCREDEELLRQSFDNPINGGVRRWREGLLKTSFCYLLLDPTLMEDLLVPSRASIMPESQRLQLFVDSIFYIGKGKKARPLQHLVDAANYNSDLVPPSAKLARILDLWKKGHGVISLHVFQSIIAAEAYTREAAMIDAIGLDRLCNLKRGDYYGIAANWALGRRRRFGAWLLKTATVILILEGAKPLKRDDILKPN